MNAAERMRAWSLVRRHWRATIAVGVFAGVAGGLALGAWGIARRTSSVYDRFVEYEDTATLSVLGCFDGITEADIYADYGGNYDAACGDYDYADLRDFLESRPEVASAGRMTLAISQVAPAARPDTGWRQLVPVAIDLETLDALGRPIVVEGRLADPEVATEATINEEAATRLGVGVGDQVVVTPYRRDEFDLAGEGADAAGGTPSVVDVVGITRRPSDLVGRLGGTSIYEDASAVLLGPAWWDAVDGEFARYSIGVLVETAPGHSNADVIAAVRAWAPDREWQFETGSTLGQDNQQTVRDAIELQAFGVRLVAVVLALAALLFAGQAVARQSRSEWGDAHTLAVIGMDRRGMVRAATIRASAIVAVAVVAAALVTIGTSWLGPVGIGRSAEPHPGIDPDGSVLAVGLPIVALLVVACSLLPVATSRRQSTASSAARPRATPGMPAAGLAGVAMSRSRRSGRLALGAAIAGVATAATVGVAALTLLGSYDRLVDDPARYGSPWDAQVGNVGSIQQEVQTRERLATIPGIESVVGLTSLDGLGDDPGFVLVAGEPVLGDADVGTLLAGRLPSAPDEIALGRLSMRQRGFDLGDEFVVTHPSDPSVQAALTVVGEVVVNSGYTNRPGVGGLVTDGFVDLVSPDTRSQVYAVWVDPAADRDATLAALRAAFPTTFLEHSTPTQVSNLGLVSDQPTVVALAVALLAGAALTHALVLSVSRSRRDIGVWRSIGFTRGQVVAAVGWHATLLSAIGLGLGIPLGVVAGRMAWRLIVDDLGLASPPVAPFAGLAVVAVVVLLVANVAALVPGVSAARLRPAAALRTE